jgi:hypothetical protein
MVVNNNAKLKLRRHNQIRVHTRIKTTLLSPRNRNINRNKEHTMRPLHDACYSTQNIIDKSTRWLQE